MRHIFDSHYCPYSRLGQANGVGLFKILTTCILLASCAGPKSLAPVEALRQPPSYKIGTHTVATGETLYSIAWRYTLDVKDLARVNGLNAAGTIYPGQELKIDLSQINDIDDSFATSKSSSVINRSRIEPNSSASKVNPSSQTRSLRWQWPARGTLIATFEGPRALNKGIDIGAEKGQPVLAAETGTVVYAGNGLRGYGKLLIIKHNENYLSAYAHNYRLLAAEGDSVKAGQQIAEIGSSGTDRTKLHFEIRFNGKPVDPLTYLPRP